jgi:hypothetical protein
VTSSKTPPLSLIILDANLVRQRTDSSARLALMYSWDGRAEFPSSTNSQAAVPRNCDAARPSSNCRSFLHTVVSRTKWRPIMDQIQFDELHTSYVTALKDYVVSAEATATMLADCTPEPMSLLRRLRLMVQERAENNAHCAYMDLKRILHSAALMGYHCSN